MCTAGYVDDQTQYTAYVDRLYHLNKGNMWYVTPRKLHSMSDLAVHNTQLSLCEFLSFMFCHVTNATGRVKLFACGQMYRTASYVQEAKNFLRKTKRI